MLRDPEDWHASAMLQTQNVQNVLLLRKFKNVDNQIMYIVLKRILAGSQCALQTFPAIFKHV